MLRIGHGYDAHRFEPGRKLVICGVTIPHEVGLLGHSDADVAVHALMDALLGAAGMDSIGCLFPDSDERYSGADSMLLLREVMKLLSERGYSVGNADITVIAQKPRMAPHIGDMRKRLSEALGTDAINVKATTEEKMGFTGRCEGIAAHAVCIITDGK